ncbi:MAG: GTP-binding protein [Capnocytophaga sp.]|uniref:sulfate adenylyltransferase subunit 1 n=1 Tax=unclassified Capnocytophaga TaxID=2640652 RepID=UPI0002A3B62C|nr:MULTISPECIES: GTP-binding protein [unclassified Capnocytophaga]EKY05600.1 sulfate adenylyltransferase subunit 1 [Capnocytophaga sp. oral taxon 380 str. F0488]MDU6659197.1 GTP-binding protein [Capnocytophaga sp.]
MNILRFITAGSVDDGKSTLIGRLLYDSKSILADQLEALEQQSKNKNDDGIDLAIITDGLRAEREQGITIDVAYRYFATPKRKFIIADAPGHTQYTRNMITGASNSELIIILVDARNGVTEQTRRHSIIASLLNIPEVVVAVNKMDLVGYSEEVFNNIKQEYEEIAKRLGLKSVHYFPISAFVGDNIVNTTEAMPWYKGNSLLDFLETVEISKDNYDQPRFQVQYVIRPQTEALHDYRGYAGEVISGTYRKGDAIIVEPEGITTKLSKIEYNGEEVAEAKAGDPVVLHIEDDIDISRGDYFAKQGAEPQQGQDIEAIVCWMDKRELREGNKYLLQQRSKLVKAIVKEIEYKIDVNTLNQTEGVESVKLNEIAKIRLKTASPLVYDAFQSNPPMGSAILIDETSNATVGAVMIY